LGSFSIDLVGFLDHRIFLPSTLGVAEGGSFFDRRNRFVGGVLGSFSIDLMGFWTIVFFYPQLWGLLQGVVFIYGP